MRSRVPGTGSCNQAVELPPLHVIFLPIAERELRVAARKPSTPWLRAVAALLALFIGAGFLIMTEAIGASPVSLGRGLFATLTWLALAATLTAGLFFTSDSLSEEKRDGTLGFLFLTDLRGYDVVCGKLLATSLRSFFALLSLFPVLAITLLMGGVTGSQFWKSSLALVNALFCSLSAGLLVSSFCRDAQRAMAGTFLLLLLVCAGGPFADSILTAVRGPGFGPHLSLSSPVYVFWGASAWGRTRYWSGLWISHLLAWGGLVLACWLVPRSWQDKPGRSPGSMGFLAYTWRYGGARVRTARRTRLMSQHPVLWLALRERWQSTGVWLLAGVVLIVFAGLVWSMPAIGWFIWGQVNWLIVVVLYLWITSHSCRFFVDAKRSGLMEVLLVAPLSSKSIILGQWHALLRLFGVPAAVLILAEFAGAVFSQQARMGAMAGAAGGSFQLPLALQVLVGSFGVFSTAANLAALMWFGMWLGLVSKNTNIATLRAVLFVQVLPWLGITFASTLLASVLMFRNFLSASTPSSSTVLMFPMIMSGLSAVMSIAKDAAFILWARGRLFKDFRTEAAKALNARAGRTVRTPHPNS